MIFACFAAVGRIIRPRRIFRLYYSQQNLHVRKRVFCFAIHCFHNRIRDASVALNRKTAAVRLSDDYGKAVRYYVMHFARDSRSFAHCRIFPHFLAACFQRFVSLGNQPRRLFFHPLPKSEENSERHEQKCADRTENRLCDSVRIIVTRAIWISEKRPVHVVEEIQNTVKQIN